MDFITHSLIGAGIARLAAPRRPLIQQLSLAGLLGSLIMDGDSWLYLLGPNFYGKYHRVVSHSLIGLTLIGILAAVIPFYLFRLKPGWRRFGWFVSDNLPRAETPPPIPAFGLLLIVGLLAAYAHFAADVITGFGNMELLWPWSTRDFTLAAVNSFEPVLFGMTLAWHVVLRQMKDRRRDFIVSAAWLMIAVLYIIWHANWGGQVFI